MIIYSIDILKLIGIVYPKKILCFDGVQYAYLFNKRCEIMMWLLVKI